MMLLQKRKDYTHNSSKALATISKYAKQKVMNSHNFRQYCGFLCELSYNYISKATKTPATNCRRVIKQMEKRGVLKAKRARITCLGKMTEMCFKAIKELNFYKEGYEVSNLFYHKGLLFYTPNNAYLLFPTKK